MSHSLISRSADLKRLRDEGYEVRVVGAHLVVDHVPYVNERREVSLGTLATTLALAGNVATKPDTHVMYFLGEFPCDKNGRPIEGLRHASATQTLTEGLVVNHSFSNKPVEGYADYYEKVTQYANVLAGPAVALDPTATAKTFRPVAAAPDDSPFLYHDTASSRAGIGALTSAFAEHRVGILGVGGTGAYVLDLVSKTPVREIHLFDGDLFLQHNAFRAPGAASLGELESRPAKVAYLKERYGQMHRGIVAHRQAVTSANVDVLDGLTFVFVCIDNGPARRTIVDALLAKRIPFVDVGMGLQLVDGRIMGTVRAVLGTEAKSDHLADRVPFADEPDDLYALNIQVADLNAINAALAVIRWKQMLGFYQDNERAHTLLYSFNANHLLAGDKT